MRALVPAVILALLPVPSWAWSQTLPPTEPGTLPAPSAHYRHAIFENGRAFGEGYIESAGTRSGSSGIQLGRGRLPVDTARFRSAPNALRLQWWSAPGGHWEGTLQPDLWRNRGEAFDGDALVLWVMAPAALPGGRLPGSASPTPAATPPPPSTSSPSRRRWSRGRGRASSSPSKRSGRRRPASSPGAWLPSPSSSPRTPGAAARCSSMT